MKDRTISVTPRETFWPTHRAIALADRLPPLPYHVSAVVRSRAEEQVSRIHAALLVTGVAHRQTWRDWPPEHFVRDPVGGTGLPGDGDGPRAESSAPHPHPTASIRCGT